MGIDTDMMFCHLCKAPLHEKVPCIWAHFTKVHPNGEATTLPLSGELPLDDQLLSMFQRRNEMCDEMLKDVSSTVTGAVEMLKESLEVKLKEQVAAQVQQEVGGRAPAG